MRERAMLKLALALLMALGFASASVVGYHVEPVKAMWSGWTEAMPGRDYVDQQVVACWDSLERVELFAGAKGNGGSYHVAVRDGGSVVMWADGTQRQNESWLKFENWNTHVAFTKGKEYVFRFSRQAGSSPIQFYWDEDPYQYGQLIVGQQAYPDRDLACRVYGRMNAVTDSFWGAKAGLPVPGMYSTWASRAVEAGLRLVPIGFDWAEIQPGQQDTYRLQNRSLEVSWMHDSAGAEIVGTLATCPSWASSCTNSTRVQSDSGRHTCHHCPPRGLWASGDANLWAEFVGTVVGRFPDVHAWECWNEPNSNCTTLVEPDQRKLDTGDWGAGWWRYPNIDTSYEVNDVRGLCSLYLRLCWVTDSVIRTKDGHDNDRVLIGALFQVTDSWADDTLGVVIGKGKDWLRMCYDMAALPGGHGVFWDGVSVHPYPGWWLQLRFPLDTFEAEAETLHAIMRAKGHYGELWNTEMGWGRTDPDRQPAANNLCEVYVRSLAAQAQPGGSYARTCWWAFNELDTTFGHYAMLDPALNPYPGFYAFKQCCARLTSKRFNGRVMTGDTLTDPLVRIYEFEDPASLKKTWVCWGPGEYAITPVKLPARSDTSEATNLDYGDNPQPSPACAEASGWLSRGLALRPVFITEPDRESLVRSDLVVDSIMVPAGARVGSVMDIHAFVKNIGNAGTPDTVALDFLCDDSVFLHATSEWAIDSGDTYEFSFEINPIPSWMHGWHLFSARVNHGQTYVEKDGMDDNAGYARRYIAYGPGGDLIGELYGSHSNEPLPLLRLESQSYESDTLGSAPAESARLVQWVCGNDTIVDGGDTTTWFCVNQAVSLDTTWAYLSGQSKYRFFIQVKDSWSESDLIPDTVHPLVVFDTTAPNGSIVINSGARFVAGSSCTLRIGAQDSLSSVAGMRLLNAPPANLISNGGFVGNGGAWDYVTGGYDESLGLGWLTAEPAQATVTQFIPAESISAHAGDSCVQEASIMAHVHEDDAVGSASFWYLSTNVNPQITDTLWQLVDSAGFSGNLLALTGRYGLSKHFLLTTPAPDTNWVWQGGMVRVEASAENGNGTVYVDNAGLIPYEGGSGYAWWANYDTLVEWSIGSGAGSHVVRATFIDSAGNWNAPPYADTVILDPTPPVVDIDMPTPGLLVNGLVEVTGWAYDPVEFSGDTWFSEYRLSYRHWDSTNWMAVSPDSISHIPAYPDSMASQGPAVHLGYWNTLSLVDGSYYLLLTASDSAGNTASCTTWIMVDQGFGGGGMRSGPEGGGSGLGEGSVFVGSATGTVLHLSDDLDSLGAFSVDDSGSQANVAAILEVGEDSILVLDAANKRVHKLHRSGQHRRGLVSGLSEPTDLKQDTNGNFYLVDRGLHRIGKFRSNGTLVFVRGGLGADSLHFHSPEGIAVRGGLVYVADGGNNRIALWDTSGNFKTTITGDFENPTAVYVSDAGAIYLTDGTDGKLKGITPLGGNIVTIGTTDSSKLKGLVPSENRHSLFSLASEPNKVYRLRIQSDESRPGGAQSGGKVKLPKTLALNQPFPNPARTRLNIAYALPRQTRVELKLYDVAGKLVTALVNGEQKPGYYNLTWSRQDTKGRSCACGIYFCTLAAENQRFSRKVILTE